MPPKNNSIVKPPPTIPSGNYPSVTVIGKYDRVWASLPNYVAQEAAIQSLYASTSPYRSNSSMSNILLKVAVLNDFYSTSVMSTYHMALHISQIADIDARLAAGDITLVDDIRNLSLSMVTGSVKNVNSYSFATKYCSHHYPQLFPIFDKFAAKTLHLLKKQCRKIPFTFPSQASLKNYAVFKEQIDILRDYCGLTNDPNAYKKIDRYLWLLGKRMFAEPNKIFKPINYSNFGL